MQSLLDAMFAAADAAEGAAEGEGGGDDVEPLAIVQAPPMDPTYTLANEDRDLERGRFVAKESITLSVGPWIVSIDKDGVTLGMGVATPPVGPDALKSARPSSARR